jgi:hypothetical protein
VIDDVQVRAELLAAIAKILDAITMHGALAIDAEQRARRQRYEAWLAIELTYVTEHPAHPAGVPLARIQIRAHDKRDVTDLIDYLDRVADLHSRARDEARRLGL